MSNLSNPKVISVLEYIKQALEQITINNNYYTDVGSQVYFMRQWFDVRDSKLPCVSYYLLEESPVEHKGCSYKQEINLKIEVFTEEELDSSLFFLISDIKRALLASNIQPLFYLGYEINLPDEGSCLISVTLNFNIHYIENIH